MRRFTLLLCACCATALAAEAAPDALRVLPGGVTLGTSPAAASVRLRPVPRTCATSRVPRLCAIHRHFARVNLLRVRMGKHRLRYGWMAERYPARRDRILAYWTRTHERVLHRYRAWRRAVHVMHARAGASPWSAAWLRGALCVHSKEGAWNANTGNGFTGGMQFLTSTWLSNGGGRYAPEAYLASPHEQLLVSYHLWRASGWSPWPNTAAACGLL